MLSLIFWKKAADTVELSVFIFYTLQTCLRFCLGFLIFEERKNNTEVTKVKILLKVYICKQKDDSYCVLVVFI